MVSSGRSSLSSDRRSPSLRAYPASLVRSPLVTSYTHQTAPTQFVDANGIRFAYRRFGKTGGVPLVFNQHYTGTMDHWDPAVTDGFAKDREVILFNNAGISTSSGEVPTCVRTGGGERDRLYPGALGLASVDDAWSFRSADSSAKEIALQAPEYRSPSHFWSARARARRRRYARRNPRRVTVFLAPATRTRIICGSGYFLRLHRRARRPAVNSSSASGSGRRTAIRK